MKRRMAADQSFLERLLDDVLVPTGFRRRKLHWYRSNDDTIQIVNLQKSDWGGQYYINLGIFFRTLSPATAPKEYQAHARVRLDALRGIDESRIEAVLNLENVEMSQVERRSVIVAAFNDGVIPFLNARSTLPQLRSLYKTNQLNIPYLTLTGRETLEGSGV